MKSPRIINVWDLLVEWGKSDTITMWPLLHPELSDLVWEWITLRINLASMNESQLLVTIESLSAQMYENCDYTWVQYTRDVLVKWEFMQFAIRPEEDQMTVTSMMTIDISERIYQLVKLTEPFQKVHPEYVIVENDDDFDSEQDQLVQWEIIFKQ